MEKKIFTADEDNMRLDVWLAGKLTECSRSYIQKLIEDGRIIVNGFNVKPNLKLKSNDAVEVSIPDPELLEVKAEKIDLDVIYEDTSIIVINKPKGMVVHPAAGNYSGTLVNALMEHCGSSLSDINGIIRPGIVHRIDKDTSGILVVAKNNIAHEKLSLMLKDHNIERIYAAVVDGIVRDNLGKVDAPIGRHPADRKKMAVNLRNSRRAVTHFKVIERFKENTYMEMQLETGRTHQIRVHMSYIGFPLTGDAVYGRKSNRFGIEGQVLHARVLGFQHPVTGEYLRFEAPLPDYFKELLVKLKNGD